jgi:hypothetical protein
MLSPSGHAASQLSALTTQSSEQGLQFATSGGPPLFSKEVIGKPCKVVDIPAGDRAPLL